jgi:3-phosphoinositide dependent protein kinase-1
VRSLYSHTLLHALTLPADYVLELASNGDLFHAIKQRGGLDVSVARYYAAELLSALEYLHAHDIIHRDLKPENCLLDAQWHLKLTDFGTAKQVAPGTTSADQSARVSFEGTAEYMAPELLSDDGTQPATRLSDVWALGCVVYQLLTGRAPFQGGTEYQTFEHIKQHRLSYPIDFPTAARDLVDRLLTADPARRLGTGGYDEIKNHVFFAGLDWTTLAATTPPALVGPARAWVWPEDLARQEEARAAHARDEEAARTQRARDEEAARTQRTRDEERAKWSKVRTRSAHSSLAY